MGGEPPVTEGQVPLRQRVLIGVSLGFAALPLMALAVIGGLWLSEPQPIRYLNEPFPTNNPVHPGNSLGTRISRCNDTDRQIVTTLARRLTNLETGEMLLIRPSAGVSEPGCANVIGDVIVPMDTPPGVYRLQIVVQMTGRWRTFFVTQHTQAFTVVE